jgi:MoaA/NifB/PqqE/SkfB family radical SAM enzyme
MLQDVGVLVDGSMYITSENLSLVPLVIEQAARLGLGSFTVSRMLPIGHGMRSFASRVSEAQLAALHLELTSRQAESFGIPVRCVGLLGAPSHGDCQQGQSLIGIRADGTVVPCVLSRDTPPDLPKPRELGLAGAVDVMRSRMACVNSKFCYSGPTL